MRPGLATEVTEICKTIGVEDMNLENVDKGEVDEAILYANMKERKVEMEKCEKLKEVKNEDFRKEQDYLMEKSVDKGRIAFRLRSRMVPKVKMNFKNMHRNNLKCEECGMEEEETQEHVEALDDGQLPLGSHVSRRGTTHHCEVVTSYIYIYILTYYRVYVIG